MHCNAFIFNKMYWQNQTKIIIFDQIILKKHLKNLTTYILLSD